MGLRSRHRAVTCLWLLGGWVTGYLFVVVKLKWAQWVFLALFILSGMLSRRLRCPRCSKRVLWSAISLGRLRIPMTWPAMPSRCRHCDLPLV